MLRHVVVVAAAEACWYVRVMVEGGECLAAESSEGSRAVLRDLKYAAVECVEVWLLIVAFADDTTIADGEGSLFSDNIDRSLDDSDVALTPPVDNCHNENFDIDS